MNVLIVYAHPEPASFTAALRDAAVDVVRARGARAVVSDLYAEGFNPVAGRHDFTTVADPDRFHYQREQEHAARHNGFSAEIGREQARVRDADVIALVFPLWWGGVPAIVKGWFERVLAYGFAYADGERFDTGWFRAKRAIIATTTGGTTRRFSEEGVFGPIERVLWPVQRLALEYVGMRTAPPFVAYAAPRVDAAQRAAYLAAWRGRLESLLSGD